jgi:hypothetical protein
MLVFLKNTLTVLSIKVFIWDRELAFFITVVIESTMMTAMTMATITETEYNYYNYNNPYPLRAKAKSGIGTTSTSLIFHNKSPLLFVLIIFYVK